MIYLGHSLLTFFFAERRDWEVRNNVCEVTIRVAPIIDNDVIFFFFGNALFKIFYFFQIAGCEQIKGLYLLSVDVPSVADYRDTVKLSCQYDMENTKLNSVKWYKDNKEFYR